MKFENLKWPTDQPERAHFVCDAHGCVLEPRDKPAMLAAGEWRADAPEHFTDGNRHASFHIWAAYSASPHASWGQLAREYVAAAKDQIALRTYKNTVLGEPWREALVAINWDALYRRRESYPIGTVPRGAVILTAGVDVQQDRLGVRSRRLGARQDELEHRRGRDRGRDGESRRGRPLAALRGVAGPRVSRGPG